MKNRFLMISLAGIALLFTSLTGCNKKEETPSNKTFSVSWKNYDQTLLEEDSGVLEGEQPHFDGAIPQKPDTEDASYVFTGWSPELHPVTEDVTYTAQFDEILSNFTVTWKNWNGDVLEVDKNVQRNAMPHYDGETPTRPSTAEYSYVFVTFGELKPVTKNVTYTALFRSTVNSYTVTWKNGDEVIKTDEVEYGKTPVYEGAQPQKEPTQTKSYIFKGWSPVISPVTGNVTYTAVYDEITRYAITWKNGDETIKTDYLEAGAMPSYTGEEPEKASTATISYVFTGWSPEIVPVTGDAVYEAQFEETARKYSVKFYDKDGALILKELLEYNSPVTAPTGEYHTFYTILGYNAKVGGNWDDTLLTSIPNVTDDVEYRVVTELKTSKDYLLNDLSDSNDVLGSTWDLGADISKAEIDDVPDGVSMSNRTKSVRVSTKNGTTTIKIGSDFFKTINEFNDADYIQLLAKFPVYAAGNKWNDVGLLLCKSAAAGLDRSAPTDNSGSAVYFNGGSYWTKQVLANGCWQEFKIYVSEIKAMLATVPYINTTEWDSIVINGIRDAASPANSTISREITVYDVEFHRVDITKDFVINDCTSLYQAKTCCNTSNAVCDNNVLAMCDNTDEASRDDHSVNQPTDSVKQGKSAVRFDARVNWDSQAAFDISLLVDNIDAFDDNDEIVTYIWGSQDYGTFLGKSAVLETAAHGGGINMRNDTTKVKNIGSGKHYVWQAATMTVAEFKALPEMNKAYCSSNYKHDVVCKTNWLMVHLATGTAGSPTYVYSIELHHAS